MNTKENKVKNVLFTLWVMIAFLLIQGGAAIPLVIGKAASALAQAGGDMNKYTEIYTESLMNGSFGTVIELVITVASMIAAIIWFMVGYRKFYSPSEYAEGRKLMKKPSAIIALVTGTLAVYAFDVLLSTLTTAVAPVSEDIFSFMMDMALGGNRIMAWLTLAVFAPINEELIFRGIIIRKSSKAFSKVFPIILVQALLFGLMHFNPLQSIYAVAMGLFLGYVAYKCKSVIPCIIAHSLNNIVADSAQYWPQAFRSIYVYIAAFVVLGAVTVWLLIRMNKKTVEE